jgi:hypothetical protein
MRSEFKLTEEGLHVCCWQNLHYVLLLPKEGRQQQAILSNVTRAANPPFSNYTSFHSLSQLSTPPETIISSTVHAADFCITSPRSLTATKMHGK